MRFAGLVVCNTPAYSPESNGMAEAFVKTLKRDYAYLSIRCTNPVLSAGSQGRRTAARSA
jgi:hypothetical protein